MGEKGEKTEENRKKQLRPNECACEASSTITRTISCKCQTHQIYLANKVCNVVYLKRLKFSAILFKF